MKNNYNQWQKRKYIKVLSQNLTCGKRLSLSGSHHKRTHPCVSPCRSTHTNTSPTTAPVSTSRTRAACENLHVARLHPYGTPKRSHLHLRQAVSPEAWCCLLHMEHQKGHIFVYTGRRLLNAWCRLLNGDGHLLNAWSRRQAFLERVVQPNGVMHQLNTRSRKQTFIKRLVTFDMILWLYFSQPMNLQFCHPVINKTDQGLPLAQVVEQAFHIQRLCPYRSGHGFDSTCGPLLPFAFPSLSLPWFLSSAVLSEQ